MKETGMVRKVDDLGRIVVPKEIRMKDHLLTPKQVAALEEKLQELKSIVKEQGANEDT